MVENPKIRTTAGTNDVIPNSLGHKRVDSNPFDIIYDSNLLHASDVKDSKQQKRYSDQSFNSFRTPTSPIVPRTPQAPRNLYTSHQPMIIQSPPITTIIKSDLSRSPSVISKTASVRNRFNIVKRNKMVNKQSLPENSARPLDSATQSKTVKKGYNKIQFLFPVKRKTSLKQKPYRLLQEFRNRKCNFPTKESLEEFFIKSRAGKIMKELLPTNMKIFQYSKILRRNPALTPHERYFHINEDVFQMVAANSVISKPFRASSRRKASHGREFNVADAVYYKYRTKAFMSNQQIPPKFTDYFPDELDSDLVTPFDIDKFNKTLLFEILLRRTLAAKIEYRLQKSGSRYKGGASLNSTSNDSSNGSGASQAHLRHSYIPELVDTDADTETDSINTDDLMQQNASLFSGLLPSPQISYKSDLFGSDFEFKPDYFDNDINGVNERKLKQTASTTDLLNLIRQTTHTPIESHFAISPQQRPSSAFKPEPNVYELKPISRSVDTFSSDESDFKTPPFELSKHNSIKSVASTFLNRKSTEWEAASNSGVGQLMERSRSNSQLNMETDARTDAKRSSSGTGNSGLSDTSTKHRQSHSTTNSSVFQDLDALSSQLSQYLKDPNPQPRFVHKNILSEEDPLFYNQQNQTNIVHTPMYAESMKFLHNKKDVNHKYPPDIVSMKGSVIGTNSETSHSSSPRKPQLSTFHLSSIDETNPNQPK